MVKIGAALLALPAVAAREHWAVIVAGSNTYSNYRHQADACHAYQIAKTKGVPEDHIILMAYDDIANNPSNPFPGKLFNKPDPTGPGVDVYEGCNIDYKGADVTPQNFMDVLTGKASGKKLESTSEDNVFIFFSDHGAPGLIAFPSNAGVLHKADLQSTFQTMSDNKMFNKLTMYLETCESGSMFEDMNIPGIYALSASNPTESSWGSLRL
jgi:legumain